MVAEVGEAETDNYMPMLYRHNRKNYIILTKSLSMTAAAAASLLM